MLLSCLFSCSPYCCCCCCCFSVHAIVVHFVNAAVVVVDADYADVLIAVCVAWVEKQQELSSLVLLSAGLRQTNKMAEMIAAGY